MKSKHKYRANWLTYFAEKDINPRNALKIFRPEFDPVKVKRMMSLFHGRMIFEEQDLVDWKNIKSSIERTDTRNNGKIFS
jgi:hypothetical protein